MSAFWIDDMLGIENGRLIIKAGDQIIPLEPAERYLHMVQYSQAPGHGQFSSQLRPDGKIVFWRALSNQTKILQYLRKDGTEEWIAFGFRKKPKVKPASLKQESQIGNTLFNTEKYRSR